MERRSFLKTISAVFGGLTAGIFGRGASADADAMNSRRCRYLCATTYDPEVRRYRLAVHHEAMCRRYEAAAPGARVIVDHGEPPKSRLDLVWIHVTAPMAVHEILFNTPGIVEAEFCSPRSDSRL